MNIDRRNHDGFGFCVTRWKPGQFKNLPDPGESFGLHLSESGATDEALAELATQKNLRVLILYAAKITDAQVSSASTRRRDDSRNEGRICPHHS